MLKLHIGCGEVYLKDWVNIDIEGKTADLLHDIRKGLPYKDNSVEFIYNEHLIEHLSKDEARKVLHEFYRVLKPGGVVRIATPDLDHLIYKYIFNWRDQEWIEKFGYQHLRTKAEMINTVFYSWGHKWIYNYEELKNLLEETQFKEISRQKLNKSHFSELQNRETRSDSKLVVEGTKS